MNCKRATYLSSREFRGELSDRDRQALHGHRASCAACRQSAREGARLDQSLRAALGHRLTAIDLRPAVMRRLDAAPRPARFSLASFLRPPVPVRRTAPALGIGLAAVVAALLAWHPWTGGGRTGPPTGMVSQPSAPQGQNPLPRMVQAGTEPVPVPGQTDPPGPAWVKAPSEGGMEQWPGGTRVALDRRSEYRTEQNGLELRAGRLHARVAPQSAEFLVRTPQAEVRVLGTMFVVEVLPDRSTLVAVREGRVRVGNPAGEVIVGEGAFTLARAGVRPLEPEPAELSAFLRWTGRLGEPLPAFAAALKPVEIAAEVDGTRRTIALLREERAALRAGRTRTPRTSDGEPAASAESDASDTSDPSDPSDPSDAPQAAGSRRGVPQISPAPPLLRHGVGEIHALLQGVRRTPRLTTIQLRVVSYGPGAAIHDTQAGGAPGGVVSVAVPVKEDAPWSAPLEAALDRLRTNQLVMVTLRPVGPRGLLYATHLRFVDRPTAESVTPEQPVADDAAERNAMLTELRGLRAALARLQLEVARLRLAAAGRAATPRG